MLKWAYRIARKILFWLRILLSSIFLSSFSRSIKPGWVVYDTVFINAFLNFLFIEKENIYIKILRKTDKVFQRCGFGSVLGRIRKFWAIRIRHNLYGAGSLHHQANKGRKTGFRGTLLRLLYYFLRLKSNTFSCHLESHWRKEQDPDPEPDLDPWVSVTRGSGSVPNVTDPQQCSILSLLGASSFGLKKE